jgi:predicted alpha-1,6-mannanase (GH76 family)
VGLELVHYYQLSGEPTALQQAEQVFDFVVSGWDQDPSHPAPGGLFWIQATSKNTDRNTISTAPAAELGLQLYQITGRQSYLEWAKKLYDWVNQTLLAPNGLYWDHIDLKGNIEKTQWSYNQGSMIGASLLFYQVTGDGAYLQRAEQVADAALSYYGTADHYFTQPAAFNAIFFKNLLLLEAENQNGTYRQAMQAYADKVWATAREFETSLFKFDPRNPVRLLDQAAMVEIYASLAADARSRRVGDHEFVLCLFFTKGKAQPCQADVSPDEGVL